MAAASGGAAGGEHSAGSQYVTHTNNLALKAMANVLLGLSTNVVDSKTVNGLNMNR